VPRAPGEAKLDLERPVAQRSILDMLDTLRRMSSPGHRKRLRHFDEPGHCTN